MIGNASSEALRMQLQCDCRIMQGLARACRLFAQQLREEPETEELLYAVAVQWERMRERLLRLSGEML
ncbi:MAG: hypothetical protein GF331_09905 [Chitinivibrionales bacterium]|jgi:hypothetical protein|nr:hypothetical protein [Chitinivibrionales bacterium]